MHRIRYAWLRLNIRLRRLWVRRPRPPRRATGRVVVFLLPLLLFAAGSVALVRWQPDLWGDATTALDTLLEQWPGRKPTGTEAESVTEAEPRSEKEPQNDIGSRHEVGMQHEATARGDETVAAAGAGILSVYDEAELGAIALHHGLPATMRGDERGASLWRRMYAAVVRLIVGYEPGSAKDVLVAGLPRWGRWDVEMEGADGGGMRAGETGATVVVTGPERDATAASVRERAGSEASSARVPVQPPSPPAPPVPPSEPLPDEPVPPPDESVSDRGGPDDGSEAGVAGDVLRQRLQAAAWDGDGCKIVLYHTHTSETYRTETFSPTRPEDYHIWDTTDTGIVQVGRALKERLENYYGVPTCHLTTVHDWPSHARAYIEARATLEPFLQANPQVQMVLDLHRDSPPDLVATVGSRRAAQIAFVLGTHPTMHPQHPDNVAFARKLGGLVTDHYPGLFRRVIERSDTRLNQDLHPRSVIVEIGSYDNHIEEALLTADLLADVLGDMLHVIEFGRRATGTQTR